MPHSAEFRLSVTRALGDQLAQLLGELTPTPLTDATLQELDQRPGVYQLYHQGELVYIGKADSSLPQRLGQHRFKLSGRLNIDTASVGFTCVYIEEDLEAVAPERLLINRFRGRGGIPWNTNGFGSNDPGQRRDTTEFEGNHFDVLYPAELDRPVPEISPGTYQAGDLAIALKAALPFVFRFKSAGRRGGPPHPDFRAASVTVPESNMTADQLFGLLAESMPDWQATALPGYVIMYPTGGLFPSARKIY
ncbi:MAG: GIY-YIG nuclease family protein [Sciscionella sp.]